MMMKSHDSKVNLARTHSGFAFSLMNIQIQHSLPNTRLTGFALPIKQWCNPASGNGRVDMLGKASFCKAAGDYFAKGALTKGAGPVDLIGAGGLEASLRGGWGYM